MSPFSDLFAPSPSRILTDDDVEPAVLNLVRGATESLVLISPYNQYWFHLKKAIEEAIDRGVEVEIGYRTKDNSYRNQKGTPYREGTEDVARLAKLGATVVAIGNLHAKIYMNESTALVASMNLTEWSTKNSREICVRIDGRERSELDDYVNELLEDGTPLPSATPSRTAPARSRASATPSRTAPAPSRAHATTGHCIRCGKDIPRNAEKPLCLADYRQWEKYENDDYPEKYCHKCGREHPTTFAKPLCLPCSKDS